MFKYRRKKQNEGSCFSSGRNSEKSINEPFQSAIGIMESKNQKLKSIKDCRYLTEEEMETVKKRIAEQERLGITMGWDIDLTIEEEIALLFVNEGKPVPQEVEMKMLEMKRLKETEGKDYFETTSMTFKEYIRYSNQLYQYVDIELDYTLVKN